jgi:hypothetical protein
MIQEEQLKDTSDRSSATSGEWLTVSQLAPRLQISERTIKRRVASGEWESRFEALPSGGRKLLLWLPSQAPEPSARATSDSERDTGRDTSAKAGSVASDKARPAGTDATSDKRDSERDTSGPKVSELQAQIKRLQGERDREREEVLFLRARVAELNAVVMQTARAIPNQAQERAVIDALLQPQGQGAQTSQTEPPRGKETAPKERREPRPLWALLLGIRPKT